MQRIQQAKRILNHPQNQCPALLLGLARGEGGHEQDAVGGRRLRGRNIAA